MTNICWVENVKQPREESGKALVQGNNKDRAVWKFLQLYKAGFSQFKNSHIVPRLLIVPGDTYRVFYKWMQQSAAYNIYPYTHTDVLISR